MRRLSRRFFVDASIQAKLLVIILPLVVAPMLMLAAVGFVTSSGEAGKTSTRYLNQRTNDLRTIAENSAIRDYFNNDYYDLLEEAEIYRSELERIFQGFIARSNSAERVYHQVRYVDPDGLEVVKVDADGRSTAGENVSSAAYFADLGTVGQGEVYVSPVADNMIAAMPIFESVGPDVDPIFQGFVIFDFVYPLSDFQRTTWILARTFVIITAISLAIALFLGINLVRRLTNPVRHLAETADRIAAGERSLTVDISTHDEIGRLAHSFNDMTASLRNNEAALRRAAAELETRVADRTKELQEANRKLEDASQHKSEFLANMSHELRTPMNAIIGFTRLVMRRSKDQLDPKQLENLQKILVSADHLLALINDILDLSKIEAGRLELHIGSFPLEPLVTQCVRTVEPMVKSDALELETDIEAELPDLASDQDKLKQILMNLLSNAVKFTDRGAVTVKARRLGDDVQIDVSDTGIGIPAEALDVIFDEFRQADSSTTREYGGTGLGLSISRHLAEIMGGDIEVASTVGEGSTFTLRIPLEFREAEGPDLAPSDGADRKQAQTDGRPIVVTIDDDPNVRYLLAEDLAEAGYQAIGAGNGTEGLATVRKTQPFAVTLDVMMPNKNGWEVLRELKADPETRDIPVILLSIIDDRRKGYRLGAFDYLLKPVDREAMVSALGRISSGRSRILVVDDDPDVIDMVRQILSEGEYDIRAAANGELALREIAADPPDVVLLDLMMPELDGFGVIERMHADAQLHDIPVLVMTAKSLDKNERELLDERVMKVIEKQGLDHDDLIRDLRAALQAYPTNGGAAA